VNTVEPRALHPSILLRMSDLMIIIPELNYNKIYKNEDVVKFILKKPHISSPIPLYQSQQHHGADGQRCLKDFLCVHTLFPWLYMNGKGYGCITIY
jgi:hypothetical protein